jgi:hypothetical protein
VSRSFPNALPLCANESSRSANAIVCCDVLPSVMTNRLDIVMLRAVVASPVTASFRAERGISSVPQEIPRSLLPLGMTNPVVGPPWYNDPAPPSCCAPSQHILLPRRSERSEESLLNLQAIPLLETPFGRRSFSQHSHPVPFENMLGCKLCRFGVACSCR